MNSSGPTNDFGLPAIYSVGDCPVCADSGAVLLLKAAGSGQLLFYCPLCGVAWEQPPGKRIDQIKDLATLAPDGVSLPTASEVGTSGFNLFIVSFDQWFPLLREELSRRR
jgi:hypothetical protein